MIYAYFYHFTNTQRFSSIRYLIRQRVNTPTADVWFILQESRLTRIKLILDLRDFNQESLYYVMSKSEFLIIRSKQIKVFILTLTLFLFEYLVSEVKSAPYLFFPLNQPSVLIDEIQSVIENLFCICTWFICPEASTS